MGIRTYSELIKINTFEERYDYLKTPGRVGEETFGFDRYLNQAFYKSKEWIRVRNIVIARDLGCDLAIDRLEIFGIIIVHHMNPITIDDLLNRTKYLLDPEFLVCTSDNTHKAIHYGDKDLLSRNTFAERKPNDTCPWRR